MVRLSVLGLRGRLISPREAGAFSVNRLERRGIRVVRTSRKAAQEKRGTSRIGQRLRRLAAALRSIVQTSERIVVCARDSVVGRVRQSWRHRKVVAELLYAASSLVSVLGFSYLVVDLRFQSSPSISSAASDPADPFRFPFSFINNSHLFSVYNVSWTCHVERMVLSGNKFMTNVRARMPTDAGLVAPGETINLPCRQAFVIRGYQYKELSMSLDVTYTLYVLGLFPASEQQTAYFRWYSDASNPQWIKGRDAQ